MVKFQDSYHLHYSRYVHLYVHLTRTLPSDFKTNILFLSLSLSVLSHSLTLSYQGSSFSRQLWCFESAQHFNNHPSSREIVSQLLHPPPISSRVGYLAPVRQEGGIGVGQGHEDIWCELCNVTNLSPISPYCFTAAPDTKCHVNFYLGLTYWTTRPPPVSLSHNPEVKVEWGMWR